MSSEPVYLIVAGLENAGKTTLIQYLRGQTSGPTNPTLGIDVETYQFEDQLVQLFDLGGHRSFRETLWEAYVGMADGLVFVVDVNSSVERLKEAKSWFWETVGWTREDSAIMFLANKTDLPHTDVSEIAQIFELKKLSSTPGRSFAYFETSALTGNGVEDSFLWALERATRIAQRRTAKIRAVLVTNQNGDPAFNVILSKNPERTRLLQNMIFQLVQLFAGIERDSPLVMETEESLIVVSQWETMFCGLICDPGASVSMASTVGHRLIEFISSLESQKPFHDAIWGFMIDHYSNMLDLPNEIHQEFQVLLIDDNEEHAYLITLAAEQSFSGKINWTVVHDAGSALDYLQNSDKRPDLIILDLYLPDRLGLDLLEELKQDPSFSQIPVLIYSVTRDPEKVHKAYTLGALGFVSKHLTPTEINQRVHAVLQYISQVVKPGH
ncbi:MAG: ADP-ribosylation factor-like protein [Candidatus Hodarchaeales archaeon]|jgi:small GTP-binding protein